MTRISFTSNIQRHVSAPDFEVEATTVAEALERYFERYPGVRNYVLDNQGSVRHHMLVLADGISIGDRRRLSDRIEPGTELFIFQALSGG
jgi:molybdopterin converting factor small subunit